MFGGVMSGPKGVSYRVVSAEEERRRAIAAAQARCRQLRHELAATREERDAMAGASATTERTPAFEGDLDLDGFNRLASRLEGELRVARAEVVAARRHRVSLDLSASYGAASAERLTDALLPTAAATAAADPEPGVDPASRLLQRVERCIGLSSGIDDEPARESVLTALAAARAAALAHEDGHAERDLLRAQTDIDRLLREQATAERARERAEHAVLDLADVTGTEADGVRAAARRVRTMAEAEIVAGDVARLRAEHAADEDRRFVVSETRAALVELGYELGGDFEVVALSGSPTVITRAGMPDHGLQLTFLPDTTRLLSNVVAFGETSPTRDREVEDLTCHDLEALQARWSEHGIDGEFKHRRDAGSVPVERVERRRRTSTTRESTR